MSVTSDVRVGGPYRYEMKPHQGPPFAFSGTYSEVTPYSRLAYTHYFEPNKAAGGAEVTVTFEDRGGKTLLTSREVFPSQQIRQLVIDTGMEPGMREAMDQLDAMVSA